MQVAVHAVAVFALCVPCASLAQGRVVEGVVVDSAGAPVPYADIIASGSKRRIAAGADGRFRFSLDSSAKRAIDVKRIGFHPRTISLEPWPDSAIRVVLAAASRTLDAVIVAAARSASLAIRGFYDRMNDVERGINHGFFITPEELDSRRGGRVTDFFQGRGAVRVKLVATGIVGQGRKGWQLQGLDGCPLEIYIDGNRFYALSTAQRLDDSHIFINDFVPASTIAGIEVYPRSVTAPPKYQSLNGRCGVVLIWTK